jgi:hypothetical protein
MSVEEVVTRVSKGKNSQSKCRRRKNINCYKCKKKGYIKRSIQTEKKNKDNENEGSSKSANVVKDNLDDADGDVLSIAYNSEHPMDSWILDLAYSFHVTPNRD